MNNSPIGNSFSTSTYTPPVDLPPPLLQAQIPGSTSTGSSTPLSELIKANIDRSGINSYLVNNGNDTDKIFIIQQNMNWGEPSDEAEFLKCAKVVNIPSDRAKEIFNEMVSGKPQRTVTSTDLANWSLKYRDNPQNSSDPVSNPISNPGSGSVKPENLSPPIDTPKPSPLEYFLLRAYMGENVDEYQWNRPGITFARTNENNGHVVTTSQQIGRGYPVMQVQSGGRYIVFGTSPIPVTDWRVEGISTYQIDSKNKTITQNGVDMQYQLKEGEHASFNSKGEPTIHTQQWGEVNLREFFLVDNMKKYGTKSLQEAEEGWPRDLTRRIQNEYWPPEPGDQRPAILPAGGMGVGKDYGDLRLQVRNVDVLSGSGLDAAIAEKRKEIGGDPLRTIWIESEQPVDLAALERVLSKWIKAGIVYPGTRIGLTMSDESPVHFTPEQLQKALIHAGYNGVIGLQYGKNLVWVSKNDIANTPDAKIRSNIQHSD